MNIAIVGAGFTGLSAAYDLVTAGHEVTVFEARTTLGGLAGGFQEPNWQWSLEHYYHHWFTSDRAVHQLLRELRLSKNIVTKNPKTVVTYQDRYYPLDSPAAVLAFPGFTPIGKLRFAVVTSYLKFFTRWQPLEKVTAKSWLITWYGEPIYRQIWLPLLKGKFGSYTGEVNMAWLWARLKTRTTKLATYSGGFQVCLDDIAKRLKNRGVKIKTAAPVKRIESHPRSLTLWVGSKKIIYDRCLVTGSPLICRQLVPGLPLSYRDSLLNLKSLGAIAVIFALKHSLSPENYYWYNLNKSHRKPWLALIEHTNFIGPSHFGGDHLVYCADYSENGDRRFRATKTELVQSCLPVLKSINPHFTKDWVRKTWVNRTTDAQPVPLLNHSRKIPPLKSPLPGLYYAGMYQIYPYDRGTNYAVDLGRRAARLMIRDLNSKS
jgi:protoporphyrinogen oxidase